MMDAELEIVMKICVDSMKGNPLGFIIKCQYKNHFFIFLNFKLFTLKFFRFVKTCFKMQ